MIINPNSSGQGTDDSHVTHPLHTTLVSFGFTYSHSTPITRSNGTKYVHHTYSRGERVVGVNHTGSLRWEGQARCGSGRYRRDSGVQSLTKYLKNIRDKRSPVLVTLTA